MYRRSFMQSILALAAAPAIVRASSIMPIRELAPSSPEAILARMVGDATLKVYDSAGRVLATLPSLNNLLAGSLLHFETSTDVTAGVVHHANVIWQGRSFPVPIAGIGIDLTGVTEVTCLRGIEIIP